MLYIFVEGPDDERFFTKIYGKCFGSFGFVKYAGWTTSKINNFIRSISSMPDNDYIFFGDADGKTIDEKKRILINRYSNLDSAKVFVVQYEIESWYYAGASMAVCQSLKLKQYTQNTNDLTKEHFNAKLPKKTDRIFIMTQLLEAYELDLAVSRNTSLSLFNTSIEKESA